MSLILDALNRSRDDSSGMPDLATRHDYASAGPARRWLVFVLSVALIGCLLLILWLFWDRGQEPPAVRANPSQPLPATVGAQPATQQPAPQAQAIAQAPVTVAAEPAPAQTADVAQAAVVEAPEATADNAAASAADAGADPAVSALYTSPPDPVAQAPEASAAPARTLPVETAPAAAPQRAPAREEEVDIEQMVRKAESELADARLEEHPAPFVSELSQQTKDDIPSVYYQRHEYSGQAGQSRVVLNGKTLQKGGSPAAGMRVEEILPDSVVLDYRGTQFRLRALNSWVNL